MTAGAAGALEAADVLARLGSSDEGLTDDEAARRLRTAARTRCYLALIEIGERAGSTARRRRCWPQRPCPGAAFPGHGVYRRAARFSTRTGLRRCR